MKKGHIAVLGTLLLSLSTLFFTAGCDTTALAPVLESALTTLAEGVIENTLNPETPTYNDYNLPQQYDKTDPLNNAFDPSTLLNTNDPTNPINGPTSSS